MAGEEPRPELTEAAFDAGVAAAGLTLSAAERAAVLAAARALDHAAALVWAYECAPQDGRT